MASSSHYENLTGMDNVHYLCTVEVKKDEALQLETKWSPIIISLTKRAKERITPKPEYITDEDSAHHGLLFKLPTTYSNDIFVPVEQFPVGSTKNIFWSKPINFRIPDDCLDYVLKKDEAAEAAGGEDHMPLQERLEGWKIEKRQRDSSDRFDKYFYHRRSGERFRSFVEVEAFIVLARSLKVRKLERRNMPLEPLRFESSKRKRIAEVFDEVKHQQIIEKMSWDIVGQDPQNSSSAEPVVSQEHRVNWDAITMPSEIVVALDEGESFVDKLRSMQFPNFEEYKYRKL